MTSLTELQPQVPDRIGGEVPSVPPLCLRMRHRTIPVAGDSVLPHSTSRAAFPLGEPTLCGSKARLILGEGDKPQLLFNDGSRPFLPGLMAKDGRDNLSIQPALIRKQRSSACRLSFFPLSFLLGLLRNLTLFSFTVRV